MVYLHLSDVSRDIVGVVFFDIFFFLFFFFFVLFFLFYMFYFMLFVLLWLSLLPRSVVSRVIGCVLTPF